MGSEDELAFFSTLDDEGLAAMTTGGGFLAAELAFWWDSRDGLLLAVGTGYVPAHAGSDAERLVFLLASRDDEIVVAARAARDDSARAAGIGRDADIEGLGTVGATNVARLDVGSHVFILPSRGRRHGGGGFAVTADSG